MYPGPPGLVHIHTECVQESRKRVVLHQVLVFNWTLVQQNSAGCSAESIEGLRHCQMTISALSPQPLSFSFFIQ